MTDHLSTIRIALATGEGVDEAFGACDALEAERLTLVGIVEAWRDGDLSGEDAMPKVRDVLERWAGDIDPDATPFDKPKMEPKTSD